MEAPIPLFKVFVAPPAELDEELLRVVHSGYVTQGPKVEQFEEALRSFFRNERVVTLNSATSAIHLALHLLRRPDGVWPGLHENVDEVRPTRARHASADPQAFAHLIPSPLTPTGSNVSTYMHGDQLADPGQPVADQVGRRGPGHGQHVPQRPGVEALSHDQGVRPRHTVGLARYCIGT